MERLNRQKHLTMAQRGAIIGQHLGGLSNGRIARSLNVSAATASKWINRYTAENTLERRPQPGQKRKLDVFDMNDVVHTILDNPFTNAAIVGREKGVHRDTIRKVWNDVGLHHHVAARKPFMTQAHRDERMGYALQNLTRDWSNVIFSDEKTFQTDRHQRTHLYRPANSRFDEEYIQPTRRSGRISGGVWGWISQAGPGEMSLITGRLNSIEYVDILNENLVRTVDISYGGLQNVVFMQDNNSVHTSQYTRNWFNTHPELELLIAPPNSPDLNPIENFWAETTRDWQNVFPRNKNTLDAYIVERWERMRANPQYFENIYRSMPNRMKAVIDNNGGPTLSQTFHIFG